MKKSHATIMTFGIFYIGAIYCTYFFMGLGLLKAVTLFNVPFLFAKITAVGAIIFGLLNIKEYYFPGKKFSIRIPMSARQKASEWAHKATIPAAIVLGFFVGINQAPCTIAIYLAILGYLGKSTTFGTGVIYLAIYNFMFVLPLIAIFLVASNKIFTEKMINWQEKMGRKMHLLLAATMILLGIVLLTTAGIHFGNILK
jgi:cytochrome c biogenesis protein CcdA